MSRVQGNQFEQQVLNACDALARRGEAAIDKTPEPMKPLAPPNDYGQFKACYTKKAEPDFHGTIAGGRAILFEAKSTATGKMEQSRVLKEQGETMDKYTALGAHCFVLATFDGVRAYRVPWEHWKTMRERWGGNTSPRRTSRRTVYHSPEDLHTTSPEAFPRQTISTRDRRPRTLRKFSPPFAVSPATRRWTERNGARHTTGSSGCYTAFQHLPNRMLKTSWRNWTR